MARIPITFLAALLTINLTLADGAPQDPTAGAADAAAPKPRVNPAPFFGTIDFDYASSAGAAYSGRLHFGPRGEQRLDLLTPVEKKEQDGAISSSVETLACAAHGQQAWMMYTLTRTTDAATLPIEGSVEGWRGQLRDQAGQTRMWAVLLRSAVDQSWGAYLSLAPREIIRDASADSLELKLDSGVLVLSDYREMSGSRIATKVTYRRGGRVDTWTIRSAEPRAEDADFAVEFSYDGAARLGSDSMQRWAKPDETPPIQPIGPFLKVNPGEQELRYVTHFPSQCGSGILLSHADCSGVRCNLDELLFGTHRVTRRATGDTGGYKGVMCYRMRFLRECVMGPGAMGCWLTAVSEVEAEVGGIEATAAPSAKAK